MSTQVVVTEDIERPFDGEKLTRGSLSAAHLVVTPKDYQGRSPNLPAGAGSRTQDTVPDRDVNQSGATLESERLNHRILVELNRPRRDLEPRRHNLALPQS
jgi:hypothetical protein